MKLTLCLAALLIISCEANMEKEFKAYYYHLKEPLAMTVARDSLRDSLLFSRVSEFDYKVFFNLPLRNIPDTSKLYLYTDLVDSLMPELQYRNGMGGLNPNNIPWKGIPFTKVNDTLLNLAHIGYGRVPERRIDNDIFSVVHYKIIEQELFIKGYLIGEKSDDFTLLFALKNKGMSYSTPLGKMILREHYDKITFFDKDYNDVYEFILKDNFEGELIIWLDKNFEILRFDVHKESPIGFVRI
jgi:hypothetical protein